MVDFLELYITTFSKDEHDWFVRCRCDGETLETLTHHDLAADGLPVGKSRKIIAVKEKTKQYNK